MTYNGAMPDTPDEYLPPTALSRALGVPIRTLVRWAREGRVHTRPSPTRRRAKLYHRGDVERLSASHVAPPPEPQPQPPTAELIPLSDMLAALNRKDDQLAEANAQLQRAALEIGSLRSQLEAHQKLLEDREQQQAAAEAERDRLQHAIERLPWWVRILFLRGK